MSSTTFASTTLRDYVAPPGSAGGKMERIRLASRRLGWSFNRTKDVWYADERVRLRPEELLRIEEITGVRYGREQIREIDQLIKRCDALTMGESSSVRSAAIAFVRSLFGAENRP